MSWESKITVRIQRAASSDLNIYNTDAILARRGGKTGSNDE